MISPPMVPSDACYNLIKGFERLRLEAYPDQGGIPTIGYGHTYNVSLMISAEDGSHHPMTCTDEQASEWLKSDVATADGALNLHVAVPLKQNQFDALVSFVFNVGVAGFNTSTLLKELNAGRAQSAADQMLRWIYVKVDGKEVVSTGLKNRRRAERKLFLA